MGYIIKRKETAEIVGKTYWLLVYGRRKVGKTFLLRELGQLEHYYTIKKDLAVLAPSGTISLQVMNAEIKELLAQHKTVVLDEFQRLDQGVLEEFVQLHPQGRLILSGSSLRVVKKIFEPQSALLGFFTPFKVGFVAPADILSQLKSEFAADRLIELSTFLREPWLIPLYQKQSLLGYLFDLVTKNRYTITSLIGEIFTEEERELSRKYEAILLLIGSGIWNTKELTSLLYARNLIPDPSPTHLIQYLKNLEEMELVESIKLHKTKGNYYRLRSPIMNVFYYLESRYDLSTRTISLEEIKPTLEKLANLEIQNFLADLFAELYEGRKEYFISPEREVDFIITQRNKPIIIGEVKWKALTTDDGRKFLRNAERLAGRKVLIGKSGTITEEGVEVFSPAKLLAAVEKHQKGR